VFTCEIGFGSNRKEGEAPIYQFFKKNKNSQGNVWHTVERANSSARLRCEAHRKESKSDRAARQEDKKGALSEIKLMPNYLL